MARKRGCMFSSVSFSGSPEKISLNWPLKLANVSAIGTCNNFIPRFSASFFAELRGCSGCRVHNLCVRAKSGKVREQTTGRMRGDGVRAENERRVAAGGVAIKDGPLVSARERRHHFVTNRRFMQRER